MPWSEQGNKGLIAKYGKGKIEQTGKNGIEIIAGRRCFLPRINDSIRFQFRGKGIQSHGLAVCHEEENRNVEAVRLTDKGKLYLEDNPHLYNPIDWKWVVTTAIAVVAAIAAIAALFVSCAIYLQFSVS